MAHTAAGLFCAVLLLAATLAATAEDPYKPYQDPKRRFTFDYPITMKVQATNPDEVKIYHPDASFRINVFIEQRKSKAASTVEALLAAFKRNLEEEMQDVKLLDQGKLPELEGPQGYLVVAFKDKKGLHRVHLVQYVVGEKHFLQFMISDTPQGFKNLEPVIRRVHHSLKILNPKLE